MNWISKNVKTIRRHRGWTQEELAKIVKANRSLVGAWEEDRSIPNYDHLINLADLCGIKDPTLLISEQYIPGELPRRKMQKRDEVLYQAVQDIKKILNSLPEEYL